MKKIICFSFFMFMASFPVHASTNVQAKDVTVNASGFNKNLNPTDNTVQKALATVDQGAFSGGGNPGGITGNIQTNNGSGGFGAYAGSTCTGQVAYAISANGVVSCTPYLTLSGLSATNPITYNNTTGAIGWTNSQNYITLTSLNSTMAGLTYTNTTGAFSLTSGYYFPTTTDETAWNAKQAAGNYITALTGDGTASGPGSAALTFATVNSNTGTFQGITVNGKGLVTAASNQNYLVGVSTTSPLSGNGTVGNPLVFNNPGYLVGVSTTSPLTGNGTSGNPLGFTNPGYITLTSLSATSPITYNNATGAIGIGTTGTWNGNAVTSTNASTVTTNANLTGPITSVGNTTSVNAQTGTGSTFVMAAGSPNFTGTVGIGSTAPGQVLDVKGTVRMTNATITGLAASSPVLTDTGKNLTTGFLSSTNSNTFVMAAGSYTGGDCIKVDGNGNHVDAGAACGITGPGGSNAQIQVNNSGSFNGYSGFVFSNSNMGIGSTAPGTALDVKGTIRTTGFTLSTSTSNGYVLTSNGSGQGSWQAASGGATSGTNMIFGNGAGGYAYATNSAVSGNNVGIGTTSNLNGALVVNGNVGIGTFTALNNALTVQGAVALNGNTSSPSYITGVNLGIGSTNPGQALDVQGTLRILGSLGNIGTGTVWPVQALTVNGNVSLAGGISTASWTDPTNDWGCEVPAANTGAPATTTGTISNSSNSLVVASASGWAVGMGLDVTNAGAGGTTDLITTITSISGTTFNLAKSASASQVGVTVYHDDIFCLNNALQSGKNPTLRVGSYQIQGTLQYPVPVTFIGQGAADPISKVGVTNIYQRSLTLNTNHITSSNVRIEGINFVNLGTTTAGYLYDLDGTAASIWNDIISKTSGEGSHGGFEVLGNSSTSGVTGAQILNNSVYILNGSGNTDSNFYVNNADPFGDIFIIGNHLGCSRCKNVYLTQASTEIFANNKFQAGDPCLKIDDSNGAIYNQTFIGNNFETSGSASGAAVIISGTSSDIQNGILISGGEITNENSGDTVDLGSNSDYIVVSDVNFGGGNAPSWGSGTHNQFIGNIFSGGTSPADTIISGHTIMGTGASHVSTTKCIDGSGQEGYCSGGLNAACGTCTAL